MDLGMASKGSLWVLLLSSIALATLAPFILSTFFGSNSGLNNTKDFHCWLSLYYNPPPFNQTSLGNTWNRSDSIILPNRFTLMTPKFQWQYNVNLRKTITGDIGFLNRPNSTFLPNYFHILQNDSNENPPVDLHNPFSGHCSYQVFVVPDITLAEFQNYNFRYGSSFYIDGIDQSHLIALANVLYATMIGIIAFSLLSIVAGMKMLLLRYGPGCFIPWIVVEHRQFLHPETLPALSIQKKTLSFSQYQRLKQPLNSNGTLYRQLIENDQLCPICFESFLHHSSLCILPCGHMFHSNCAETWLVDYIGQCPLCKLDIGMLLSRKEVVLDQLKWRWWYIDWKCFLFRILKLGR